MGTPNSRLGLAAYPEASTTTSARTCSVRPDAWRRTAPDGRPLLVERAWNVVPVSTEAPTRTVLDARYRYVRRTSRTQALASRCSNVASEPAVTRRTRRSGW